MELRENMFMYAWNHVQIISMKAYVIHQRYMYYVNVCKINCINSISGSMRLVCRGDNPNKETLIYISYLTSPSTRHIQPELQISKCVSIFVICSFSFLSVMFQFLEYHLCMEFLFK